MSKTFPRTPRFSLNSADSQLNIQLWRNRRFVAEHECHSPSAVFSDMCELITDTNSHGKVYFCTCSMLEQLFLQMILLVLFSLIQDTTSLTITGNYSDVCRATVRLTQMFYIRCTVLFFSPLTSSCTKGQNYFYSTS